MKTPKERFIAKTQQVNSCWLWTAARRPGGKGSFRLNGENMLAHRAAWLLFKGELPADTEVLMHCGIAGCVNPAHASLRKISRRPAPAPLSKDFRDKFWRQVDMTKKQGCWPWTGYISPQGFGTVYVAKTMMRTHRVAYEIMHGPVEEGHQVYHTCQQRHCCNPAHLFTNTAKAQGQEWSEAKAYPGQQKQCCAHGHEFTPENTRIDANNRRVCRQCAREASYLKFARRKGITHPAHTPRPKSTTHCLNGHPYPAETEAGKRTCSLCVAAREAKRAAQRALTLQLMSPKPLIALQAAQEQGRIIHAATIQAQAEGDNGYRAALYFWPAKGFYLWDDKPVHPMVADYLVKHLFRYAGPVRHQGEDMIAYQALPVPSEAPVVN